MPQAQAVLEAMDWLSGIGDQTFVEASYAEVVRDLARATGVFWQWRIIPGQAGISVYTVPAQAFIIEQVVYYPDELPKTDSLGLDLAHPAWRSETGTPIAWMEDLQRADVFQVYPVPEVDGIIGDDVHPEQNFVVFTRDVPDTSDIPDYLNGVIAIGMAMREAARLGETQDLGLAQALSRLLNRLTALFLDRG